MTCTAVLGTEDVSGANTLRFEPEIGFPARYDILLDPECGNIETVQNIDRFQHDFDRFPERHIKLVAHFPVFVLKRPVPHAPGGCYYHRIFWNVTHHLKSYITIVKHPKNDYGRDHDPRDFEPYVSVDLTGSGMALLIVRKIDHKKRNQYQEKY